MNAPNGAGRLGVTKTYKLYVGGSFPRSESGRTTPLVRTGSGPDEVVAHLCRASRKDLRGAVEAARAAQGGWQAATAYLRGQILYRLAEMLEGKASELAAAIACTGSVSPAASADEVVACIDRVVCFAGWSDKHAQVLSAHNPVAGPYYNYTTTEPTGVVAVVTPDEPSLLGLLSLALPAVCAGNAVVVLASETNGLPACVLGEALATSDLPGGVFNILTGLREELVPQFATHRDIDGIIAAGVGDAHAAELRAGAAENLKRVRILDAGDFLSREHDGVRTIEPFIEYKTVWHPSAT